MGVGHGLPPQRSIVPPPKMRLHLLEDLTPWQTMSSRWADHHAFEEHEKLGLLLQVVRVEGDGGEADTEGLSPAIPGPLGDMLKG